MLSRRVEMRAIACNLFPPHPVLRERVGVRVLAVDEVRSIGSDYAEPSPLTLSRRTGRGGERGHATHMRLPWVEIARLPHDWHEGLSRFKVLTPRAKPRIIPWRRVSI